MAKTTKSTTGGRKKRLTPKTWLLRQCDNMERHIVARGYKSERDMDDERPSKRASTVEWARWYGDLRAFVFDEARAPGRSAEAEERMLAALREEPVDVKLMAGDEVMVHPKGLDALLWLRARGWLIDWLSARVEALREALDKGETDGVAEPVTSLQRLEAELAYQLGACCAVAVTEGPGLGPYREPEAELPDRWCDAHPLDLFRVNAAFQEVNAGRLEALARIVRPKKGSDGGRVSWNVFMGTLAMRLNADPADLARDRSLVSLLATVRLAAESEPESS